MESWKRSRPAYGALAVALVGGWLGGYLLGAFQVPALVWLTVAVMAPYLIWMTTEAIALASLWLTGLLAIAVVQRPWPAAWAGISPWTNPQLWSQLLLGLWGLALLLLISLALAAKHWRAEDDRGRALVLTILYWLVLAWGAASS